MFFKKKKCEEKQPRKMLRLYVLFKNAESFRVTMPDEEECKNVLNGFTKWFYSQKGKNHYLRLYDDVPDIKDSRRVEVVVFNREEICYVSLERFTEKVGK